MEKKHQSLGKCHVQPLKTFFFLKNTKHKSKLGLQASAKKIGIVWDRNKSISPHFQNVDTLCTVDFKLSIFSWHAQTEVGTVELPEDMSGLKSQPKHAKTKKSFWHQILHLSNFIDNFDYFLTVVSYSIVISILIRINFWYFKPRLNISISKV